MYKTVNIILNNITFMMFMMQMIRIISHMITAHIRVSRELTINILVLLWFNKYHCGGESNYY